MKNQLGQQKPTRVRFMILFLIFINVVINYMDRSNLSIAAPLLREDLGLSTTQMGLILSAFGWTYALLQIPGGWFLDRIGPRVVYGVTIALWSVATLAQGFVKGFGALFGLRLSLGVFEAPAYPTNNRMVTSWFPDKERASAIGFYTSGQFVGLDFLTPVLMMIQEQFGWRGMFIITGLIGVVWAVIWYVLYRDPQHSKANDAELDYIRQGGGLALKKEEKAEKTKTSWKDLKFVMSQRKLWGIYIGQFCLNSTLWFFLTWFPTYLVDYRHMSFIKAGFMGTLPFLAAFVGVLLSGAFSDYLIRRGTSMGVARKTPIIVGLLLSVAIVGANYVDSPAWVIFFLTVAFFGNGFASITWVFVSSLAPSKVIGLTGGVFNFIGNLASIVVPLVIGMLIEGGNFAPALVFIAVLALIGALSYIFLVGKVERLSFSGESEK